MRCVLGVLAIFVAGLATPTFAQDAELLNCDTQVEVVMAAVNARADGQPLRRIRRDLRNRLGREAGDLLTEWIYTLPESQLTDAVGDAWRVQCVAALEQLLGN